MIVRSSVYLFENWIFLSCFCQVPFPLTSLDFAARPPASSLFATSDSVVVCFVDVAVVSVSDDVTEHRSSACERSSAQASGAAARRCVDRVNT